MNNRLSPLLVVGVRCAGAVTVIFLVLFGVHRAVGFGGQTVAADFRHPARFVGDLKPVGRRDAARREGGKWRTAISQSPVLVDFSPLAQFDQVAVTAKFVPYEATEVLVGALGPSVSEEFAVRPVWHAGLESLAAAGWTAVTEGSRTLYQRTAEYSSIEDFVRHPPPASRMATYHAPSPAPVALSGYVLRSAADAPIEHAVVLRGHHRFIAYVAGEPLDVEFVVQDMNRERGRDPVDVVVYPFGGGPAVARASLADDGDVEADQRATGLLSVRTTSLGLATGAYQIEFVTTDDVFVRAIRTRQQRFAALGRVFLGDSIGYSPHVSPTRLAVAAGEIAFTAPHQDSAQAVQVGGDEVHVGGGYARAVRIKQSTPTVVTVPSGDLIIEMNGQIAFGLAETVLGTPYEVGALTTAADLGGRGINYVLATYVPAKQVGDAVVGTASFSQEELGRSAKGGYRFALEVPGLVPEEAYDEVDRRTPKSRFDLESLAFRTSRGTAGIWDTFTHLGALLAPLSTTATDPLRAGQTYEDID
jgi:hypothetical protein